MLPLQLRDESVTGSSTQDRLGKDRLGKDSNKGRTKFVPPTVEEVKAYCLERKNGIDPQAFIDHYTANNWMRGKTKISDWKACVRTWENRRKEEKPVKEKSSSVESMEKDIEFRFAKLMQEYGDVK